MLSTLSIPPLSTTQIILTLSINHHISSYYYPSFPLLCYYVNLKYNPGFYLVFFVRRYLKSISSRLPLFLTPVLQFVTLSTFRFRTFTFHEKKKSNRASDTQYFAIFFSVLTSSLCVVAIYLLLSLLLLSCSFFRYLQLRNFFSSTLKYFFHLTSSLCPLPLLCLYLSLISCSFTSPIFYLNYHPLFFVLNYFYSLFHLLSFLYYLPNR